MKGPPSQRVALVTGGAVRIGAAISEGLAHTGHDLVVTYRSSEEPARELEERVRSLGRRCALVWADLADPQGCAAVVRTAAESYGRLDVVVNSASTFEARPLASVDAAAWDAVMAVNVRAPHLVVRAAIDLLRASRGSVVNIADLSALEPWTAFPDHSVSKAALVHLTRVQAKSLAPEVRVNAVVPGAVLQPEHSSPAHWDRLAKAAPLERTGSPADVVDAVRYLIAAEFVTGQVLTVDGGRSLGTTTPP
ncbi:MAG: SDR family oxidoreductase [Gemmatimonadota bacterium]|nr:SDR family oxidoreductase [Gemmatimonadota bacterium]